MTDTRKHDIEQLRQDYQQTNNPKIRQTIADTARKISRESGEVKSMREALLKAKRSGNSENVKDIHEYIKDNSKYQNE